MTEYTYTMLTDKEKHALIESMKDLMVQFRMLDCMAPDVYYDLLESREFSELHSALTGKLRYVGDLKRGVR